MNHRQLRFPSPPSSPKAAAVVTATDELIDLLADDALDAPRRGSLLRSFDVSPDGDGWRRCALALLEAQAWRRAMGESPGQVLAEPSAAPVRRARGFPRLAVAAVVAAFAVGTLLGLAGGRRGGPGTPELAGQPTGGSQPTVLAQGVTTATDPAIANAVAPLPEYVRRQLEREGYQIQGTGSRMIPVALGDGRTVSVPVATLKYQYVGRQVR